MKKIIYFFKTKKVEDPLESQEFYELMNKYRHTPISNQKMVTANFNEIKKFIKQKVS
jgi:arginyl-tRNA--protein-N-Asp/Glu arginylyltransferase